MKHFFITAILLSVFYPLTGQVSSNIKEDNILNGYIEIKIRGGYTSYGTSSITLQREGLIYWRNPFLADLPEEAKKETAKFIPYTELNQEKVFEIMKYVQDQSLYDIKELPEKDHFYYDSIRHLYVETIPPRRGSHIALSFVVHETNRYAGFIYKYYDPRIDTLIRMMNELIPMEDRQKFIIKGPLP